MDYTRALTFVFKEHKWIKKIIITGLLTLIPIIGQFHLIGWAVEISKRVIDDDYEKIPEAASWNYLLRGIKLFLIYLVYSIPVAVIWLALNLLTWIWKALFNGALENFGIQLFHFLQNATGFVYFILFLFIMPAVILIFLETEQLRDSFNFRKVYLLVKNNNQLFFTLIIALAVAVVIASLGVSVFYVGIILTIPYAIAFYAHLLGQTGRII